MTVIPAWEASEAHVSPSVAVTVLVQAASIVRDSARNRMFLMSKEVAIAAECSDKVMEHAETGDQGHERMRTRAGLSYDCL